jgi:beta-lactamase class A
MKLLKNKKSLGIIIFSILASNAFTYYYIAKKKNADTQNDISAVSTGSYKVQRLAGFKYVNPILLVDDKYESENLNGLKQNVTGIIENYKKIGVLNSASFFLKEFNGNGWTGTNVNEKFLPGSLMKVPELIAYLKMNELKPGTLDRVISYDKVNDTERHTNFNSKSIQVGKKYTIRELLTYMIKYSDNQATSLLNDNVDITVFGKVFTDLGLPIPDWKSPIYPISSRDYSLFMRALYNGSYLNKENSEIGLELLSQCDFNRGLIAGMPKGTQVIHKFGEAGDANGQQFSESAIIYLDNNCYVLTIMTAGKDYKQLPQISKEISASVYQFMQMNPIPAN